MAMQKLHIETVNAMAELERLKYKFLPAGGDEIRMKCPVHDDESPSLTLNVKKNLWNCHSAECLAKGDIISLLSHIAQCDRRTMFIELADRYPELEDVKQIQMDVVEKFHRQVWDAGPLLQALYDRGLTEEDIRAGRIGYHDGRITIPVFDEAGRCINIRRYLPGAPAKDKMKNTTGFGKPRIYMPEQLKFPVVWLLGGELKARVAARLLNPHGIGATSITAGEGNWEVAFNDGFKGKTVYFCYDVDKGGRAGANNVAMHLQYYASALFIIRLPLDTTKYPKGDINDWVGREGATADDLLSTMRDCERWIPPEAEAEVDDTVKPVSVKLSEATNARLMGRPIELEAIVAALDTTPFIVPREIGVKCTKDQPNCPWCPVKPKDVDPDRGHVKLTIRGTASGMLEMINAPKKAQREAIRAAVNIPPCKVAEFAVYSHYNVVDSRLAPQLTISNEAHEHVVQPAFIVSADVELNTPYRLTGRVYPNPKTQQAVLLLAGVEQVEDSLHSFAPDVTELEQLKAFQCKPTVADIQKRLDAVYEDLEANVTQIYGRRDLHLVVDLFYHSPLLIDLDGRVGKGWTDILVIGDSSQGKSETSSRLKEHYGLGDRVECKNASVAGLLGGLQQINGRWFVEWGVIPKNDRRAVILEEVKGASTEVIGKLTDMRSSGIAEIPKIEKRRTNARTRLLWVTNPRSDRQMSAYNFGVEAIKELIGGLEDIRRFDLAIIVSSKQVSPESINKLRANRPNRTHLHVSEMCRRLILWTWTRKADQVIVDDDAAKAVMEGANKLCLKFTESLPLVDRGTMRHKISRLSAALAARLFSTDSKFECIRVHKAHVDYIVGFIDKVYSDPVFGYLDYSAAQVHANNVKDGDAVINRIKSSKYPRDFVESVLYSDEITSQDFANWCELDREEAERELSFYVRKHCIYRDKRSYRKTIDFIVLLKKLKDDREHPLPERGKHAKGDKF